MPHTQRRAADRSWPRPGQAWRAPTGAAILLGRLPLLDCATLTIARGGPAIAQAWTSTYQHQHQHQHQHQPLARRGRPTKPRTPRQPTASAAKIYVSPSFGGWRSSTAIKVARSQALRMPTNRSTTSTAPMANNASDGLPGSRIAATMRAADATSGANAYHTQSSTMGS